MSAVLRKNRAIDLGYSLDKRKRRRQHRFNAKSFRKEGGDIYRAIEQWHLAQARYIK